MEKTYLMTGGLIFGVDWLLIMTTCKLWDKPLRHFRSVFGAFLGGVYGYLATQHGFAFLGRELWWLLMCIGTAAVAFELDWCCMAVFTLVKLGVLGLMSGGVWGMVLCASVIVLVMAFRRDLDKRDRISIRIPLGNEVVQLIALRDTGNLLRDPVTGKCVVVVSAEFAEKLVGLSSDDIQKPLQTVMKYPGLRLIPYSTIGNNGFLVGKRFENVEVGGKVLDLIIGFSPNKIGSSRSFQALTGGYGV